MEDSTILQGMMIGVFHALGLPSLRVVHRYMAKPQGGEPDPGPLVEWLRIANPGLIQSLPRVLDEDQVMIAVEYDGSARLETNRWGIPEPLDGKTVPPLAIDLVFVPLLAFDLKGHRVGHGKGYYDRFLKLCRVDCIKAGLSFFEPVDAISDPDEHDVRLDLCITPYMTYEFH